MDEKLALEEILNLATRVSKWEFSTLLEKNVVTESAIGEVEGARGLVVHLSHRYNRGDSSYDISAREKSSSIQVTQYNATLPGSYTFSYDRMPEDYARLK